MAALEFRRNFGAAERRSRPGQPWAPPPVVTVGLIEEVRDVHPADAP